MTLTGPVPGGGPRGPGPRAPHQTAGGGPPEKNDAKIADFVKDSSKNRKIFGALSAHIVAFLYFCRRRARIVLGLENWTKY